jgi:hypothetical protein
MLVLRVLVFALASYIRTSGYLLGPLPSRASLLDLLFLSLEVLPLCFLPLLDLLGALRLLPPMALTKPQLGLPLPVLASAPSAPIYLSSVGLASIILR